MKTRKITIVALILGICTFATAAFANYQTSNGYDVLKKSIKGAMGLENYTLNTELILSSDDEEIFKTTLTEEYDGVTKNYYRNEYETDLQDHNSVYSYTVYSSPNVYYGINTDGTVNFYNNFSETGVLSQIDKSDKTISNVIRFGELFTDTMVGDLKNNFTLIDSNYEASTYEIKLSSIQIPEIVNAGFSIIFSQVTEDNLYYPYGEDDLEYKLLQVGAEPTVTDASLVFTVDNGGNLMNCKALGTLSGNGHELSLDIDFSLSDIGTTVPKTISEEDKARVNNSHIVTESSGIIN